VPVWVAGYYGKAKPLRRAARHQGIFPLGIEHPDRLAEVVAEVTALRKAAGGDAAQPYDVVVALPPGTDPTPYAAAGATWCLVEFPWIPVSADQLRGVIRDGTATPPAPALTGTGSVQPRSCLAAMGENRRPEQRRPLYLPGPEERHAAVPSRSDSTTATVHSLRMPSTGWIALTPDEEAARWPALPGRG
jgi:hypothetical protein